jgi:sec-independent protein translocase protein TatC
MRFFRRKKVEEEPKSSGNKKDGERGKDDDKGKKKGEDKEMSFLDHAEELRKRIIVVLIVFAVAFIPAYIYHKRILDFLTDPLHNRELVFLEITEPFLVNIKLAFFAAAAVAIPVLVYQIVIFVKPALSQKIRKNLMLLTTVFFVLFAGGVAFSYFFLIPIAVNWLLSQGEGLTQTLSVSRYVSFIGWFLLGSGILFEMPLVLLFLIKADIITVKQLRKQWRIVYIIILLLCAIITPDWSPVTMGVLAVPMILLYELSLVLAKYF